LLEASGPVAGSPAAAPSPKFQPAVGGGFTFDTGVLRGRLRAGGKSQGLTEVFHVPTGMRLDSSMGWVGHYRVFTAQRRYGNGAWDWPSEAQLQADGSVEACWPATAERPFELRASYRWATPQTLEVLTTVRARTNLLRFESFLASYFAEGFTNALAYVAERPGQPAAPGFLTAEPKFGTWLVFPRDAAAMTLVRDGRWALPPNPVEWVEMPRLAAPLALRRHPATGLTAVLLAPPAAAFAVCMPQQTEAHRSLYLSLFGQDLRSGETARAHARLLLAAGLSDAEAWQAYNDYLRELNARRRAD